MEKYQFQFCILLLIFPFSLYSQNKNGSVFLPDSVAYPYIVIEKAEVSGNRLTRPEIIIRELDFKIGDSLSAVSDKKAGNFSDRKFYPADSSEMAVRLNYSRENLINTKLFLTVDLRLIHINENHYRLLITVNERHYWWIFPVAKLNAPNFNEWLRDIQWSDLSMGLFFSHNNLFGKGHQTSVIAYFGKSWAVALGYKIPWIGSGKKSGLTMTAGYSNLYTVEYASVENKRQMLYSPNSSRDLKVSAKLTLRPGLYNYGTVKLTGEYIKISDSLFSLNENYLAGNKKENTLLSLYADYSYDDRNSKTYPLKGNILTVFIDKTGMGLFSKDINLFTYGIDFHFYQVLGRKWYLAEMFKAENSASENTPYYYQLSMTQGKDFIRGFDLYTIKGDQIYYSRNNIKFELVPPSVKNVNEGQEKNKFKALQYAFYLNAFADAGYCVNNFTENNRYNNKMLFSWGAGFDFVTYYDLVIRFEYAFTSIGVNGFYFGFGMPI